MVLGAVTALAAATRGSKQALDTRSTQEWHRAAQAPAGLVNETHAQSKSTENTTVDPQGCRPQTLGSGNNRILPKWVAQWMELPHWKKVAATRKQKALLGLTAAKNRKKEHTLNSKTHRRRRSRQRQQNLANKAALTPPEAQAAEAAGQRVGGPIAGYHVRSTKPAVLPQHMYW